MYYLALNNHQDLGKFHYLENLNVEEEHIQKLRKIILSRKSNLPKLERNMKSPMTFKPQNICLVNIWHAILYLETLFLID